MIGRWMICLGLGLGSVAFGAGSAHAQEAPAASSIGSDVVRLKNGGLVRGTINSLLPGESVSIVTSAGKTHEFAMGDVEYAGPSDKDPSVAAAPAAPASAPATTPAPATNGNVKVEPYVTVESQRASVHLESDPPGLTFHRASTSAIAVGDGGRAVAVGYERLCTAPCDVTIPAGTEVLALSRPGEAGAREAQSVTLPAGHSRVLGSFQSRAGLRTFGWVFAAVTFAAGGAMTYVGMTRTKERCSDLGYCSTESDVSMPLATLGAVVLVGGPALGGYLAFRPDIAKVQVGSAAGAALPSPTMRGVSLQGQF